MALINFRLTSISKQILKRSAKKEPAEAIQSGTVSQRHPITFNLDDSETSLPTATSTKQHCTILEKPDQSTSSISFNEFLERNKVKESVVAVNHTLSDDESTHSKIYTGLRYWAWPRILGALFLVLGIAVAVIVATYAAIINEFGKHNYNHLGDIVTNLASIRTQMVDPDTPEEFHTWKSSLGEEWQLAFSDEFNAEGRTFYPGEDQFWEAVDIHYAATENLEWLDPAQVSTVNGTLRITLEEKKSHGLNYTSGMLQTWNKMCFTQGYVEASIRPPGQYTSKGLWPAFWALGNLGRAGYMASTEGTWPYTYDSCDAGITPWQSQSDGLSRLPGMKLSKCVCDGEDHPNPGVSRSAPEIDIMEGLHNSFAQTFNVAPFDLWRYPDYDHIFIPDFNTTAMNPYMGTSFQEAVSAVTTGNKDWFSNHTEGSFVKFGMEYRSDMPNRMDNYINFYINDKLTFHIAEGAFHPDGNIDWRLIPKEPMSLIMNLGLSKAWSEVDFKTISFPVHMDVDYVRIYQPKDKLSLTCDPLGYPTTDYINRHKNAYTNANLTSWEMAGYFFPQHSLIDKCPSRKDIWEKIHQKGKRTNNAPASSNSDTLEAERSL